MLCILDTTIAIYLRDGDPTISARLAELPVQPAISVLTRVELEGGVYRDPAESGALRARLDLMLEQFTTLPFTDLEAAIYGSIVERMGYSRTKVIDRMIAAQAMAIGATLVTLNGRDFQGMADLMLDDWSR